MQKFFDCGIDLGTTNSCIAVPDNDNGCEVVQSGLTNVTPSAVMINKKGVMVVGERAYNTIKAEDLAVQFKRQMGSDKEITFVSSGMTKTPIELSSEILKKVRADAKNRYGRDFLDAVITVPAAFKTLQSEATNKAAELAGFRHVILLQEPIAAAVAYGARPDAKDKYWMVYDYGGGTLDVAIISTKNGRLEVINSEGDNYFGGTDIDRMIYREIVAPSLDGEYSLEDALDESTADGRCNVRQLLLGCEQCKIELSTAQEVRYHLKNEDYELEDDNGDVVDFDSLDCTITRVQLESLIADTVERSITIAQKALEGAGLTASQLDKIILVGGSSRFPLVQRRLSEVFGVDLDCSIDPMTVVARGAAIYAATQVLDVEDSYQAAAGEATFQITYDSITSAGKTEVVGKIINPTGIRAQRVNIARANKGATWSSGWMDIDYLTDDDGNEFGVFMVDVALQTNSLNSFVVTAQDARGNNIPAVGGAFEIRHNETSLKMSAPPAPMSLGVMIEDPKTGYAIIDVVVKKNTPLPAKAERTYRTTKALDPDEDDEIRIEIFEGENVDNPIANSHTGAVTVRSSAMEDVVPKGSEVEIAIEIDENRNIHITGYIPSQDYEIPEETLRSAGAIDLEDTLDKMEDRIQQAETSVQQMKANGVDVTEIEQELEEIKDSYDDTLDNVDNDEASASNLIDRFDAVETKVIRAERTQQQAKKKEQDDNRYKQAKDQIERFGDDDQKSEFEDLEEQLQQAANSQEEDYILNKMANLGFEAMTWNFDFMSFMFTKNLADDNSYTNRGQADFWKNKAREAIRNHNTADLRKAVFSLLDLKPSGANDAISRLRSDLTM